MHRVALLGTPLILLGVIALASAQSADPDCRRARRAGSASGVEAAENRPAHPLIAVLDLDEDGVLSAEEIDQASSTLRGLDVDGDGSLTAEELPGPPRRGPREVVVSRVTVTDSRFVAIHDFVLVFLVVVVVTGSDGCVGG